MRLATPPAKPPLTPWQRIDSLFSPDRLVTAWKLGYPVWHFYAAVVRQPRISLYRVIHHGLGQYIRDIHQPEWNQAKPRDFPAPAVGDWLVRGTAKWRLREGPAAPNGEDGNVYVYPPLPMGTGNDPLVSIPREVLLRHYNVPETVITEEKGEITQTAVYRSIVIMPEDLVGGEIVVSEEQGRCFLEPGDRLVVAYHPVLDRREQESLQVVEPTEWEAKWTIAPPPATTTAG